MENYCNVIIPLQVISESNTPDRRSVQPPTTNTNHNTTSRPISPSSSQASTDSESFPSGGNAAPSFAVQWNISGLRSHLAELQLLIGKYQPIIIGLQETNADSKRLDQNSLGKNYKLFLSHCSPHGRQGAGMAI